MTDETDECDHPDHIQYFPLPSLGKTTTYRLHRIEACAVELESLRKELADKTERFQQETADMRRDLGRMIRERRLLDAVIEAALAVRDAGIVPLVPDDYRPADGDDVAVLNALGGALAIYEYEVARSNAEKALNEYLSGSPGRSRGAEDA